MQTMCHISYVQTDLFLYQAVNALSISLFTTLNNAAFFKSSHFVVVLLLYQEKKSVKLYL